jgi:hypothetical protein
MKNDYPIPKIMEHLKIDERGYAIPYFVPIIDGVPNFKYQDQKKRWICLQYFKCSICGKRLQAKSFWFITGPLGLHNKVVSDAPMHEECARYALNVCPHIAFQKSERKITNGDPHILQGKPESIILIKADKIGLTDHEGRKYITFRPVYTEKYTYENNKLIPSNDR